MTRPVSVAAMLVALVMTGGTTGAAAQGIERASARLIQEVMPEADSFAVADGDPPVKRGYRDDELIGYVFLTSDLPPEEQGYSGPIEVLVGVDTAGVITGVRVTAYRESLRYEWGDFLGDPFFLAQFRGKNVADPFGVRQDIDGISGVTISVRAMARTVRNTARRVAIAYLPPPGDSESVTEEALLGMSWYEIRRRGLVATMPVRQRRRNPMEISLIHVSSEGLAEHLVGSSYESLVEDVAEAGGADEVVLYVVEGDVFVPALRTGWYVEQGGRTVELPRDRVLTVGRPGGVLSGQSSQFGALLLDDDEVDITAPITFLFDRDRPDLGTASVEYTSRASFVRMAEAERAAEAGRVTPQPADVAPAAVPLTEPTATTSSAAAPTEPAPLTDPATAAAPATEPATAPATQPQLVVVSDEEMFPVEAMATPWGRTGLVALVIALGLAAFLTKKVALRWVSLAATVVLLGWVDGGFLSISHVTGLIWVGLEAIRRDPALVVLTVFTVASGVLWGRVFCGFLCPFGALQDFIDRFVPRSFKREFPPRAHRLAWMAKYVVLAVILGAAIAGVQASLYQYVEPFGTVFLISRNPLLWLIAGAFLVASAVVPRFYCRYACPLGALLAIGSVLSLRRIRRVEQCDHCHVCEQRCPTRAIVGPEISFSECVRCNVCEVQLIEKHGVCRHDMEEIRPRLVQLGRAVRVTAE